MTQARAARGARAQLRGLDAEAIACAALVAEGWAILGRRLRTEAGEIDAVANYRGLLAFIEVKARSTLSEAAAAVSLRQQRRLMAGAEILLARYPEWLGPGTGQAGIRFDVIVVDMQGRVRRVADAFRIDTLAG